MSYLICDKCGRYYKLQEGESPNDFSDKCECSGTLKHVVLGALETESFGAEETLKHEGFGTQIEDLLVTFPTDFENQEFSSDLEYFDDGETIKPKSIGVGVPIILLIYFTTLYIIPDMSFAILIIPTALLIGSFAAAYTSGVTYKQGITNGILTSVIAGCISFVIILILKIITTSKFPHLNESLFELTLQLILIFILIPTFFGFIGSLTAVTIKTREMELNWKIFGEGTILTAILFFSTLLLSPLIGGVFAGSKTDGDYWEGIKHGFFIGGFGTTIAITIGIVTGPQWLKTNIIPDLTTYIIVRFIIILILIFVIGGILGSVGGATGTAAKKIRRNRSDMSD